MGFFSNCFFFLEPLCLYKEAAVQKIGFCMLLFVDVAADMSLACIKLETYNVLRELKHCIITR